VAIRITAYYTEDLSKDVAKMLPFAILGIFLVDSSYFSIESVNDRINMLPEFINLIIQFLLLIIFTEWILRAILSIKNYIFPKKEGDSC
jgi:branched-subunit amino acid transport protein AzlD